ncbi:MAG: glutathione transport system substrate-binding protein [Nocardioidaceae bacterium]|jgi:peptide/nickel transport system substrate-binding protein|nr:glutathione transport system substrate-binding protein [Nocardioidaceae bacterium]
MKAKRTAVMAAGAAIALLTVSACGGSSDSSGGSDNNGAVLAQTAWAKASYDDVKQGGTLVQSIGQLPDNYNYNQLNGALGDLATIQYPITSYTGTKFREDGQWEIDKDYILSAKLVSKAPEKIDVKLNPKAVWSDGTPITAADMISFWKAMRGTDKAFEVVATNGYQDMENIEQGASQFEYTITYKKVNADWPNYMYPALPKSVSSSPDAFNKGFVKKQYPSNGPFVISNIDQNAQVVTETPNPKWWGRKPKLDKLIFRVVDQNALGQAFANKEIDVLDTQANADTQAQAKKRADVKIQRSGGITWTHLTMNAKKPPFDNVNVRKGVAEAIDRETMAQVVQKGLGVKPVTQGSAIYVPGQKGYQDNESKILPYSTKKAEADFKAAGYKKGSDGVYAKDGKPLSFSITVPSDTATNAQRAQLIQGFLKKVGVTVRLETVPVAKYFVDYVSPLNFQAVTFSWQGTGFPVSSTESLFYPVKSGQNYTGQGDAALGDLWDKANAELDPAKQTALANDIDKKIYELGAIVTIAPTPTIYAVKNGIVNIGASQFQTPDYTQVGYKK